MDEADPAFDETAGDEAAGGVVAGVILVEAVEFADVGRFGGEVEGVGGGGLHACGERVGLDAGVEVGVAGVEPEVVGIELVEEIELSVLGAGWEVIGRVEVEEVWRGGFDHGALVDGGEPSGGPVVAIEEGLAVGAGEGEVGWEVVGDTAEAVVEP